MKISPARKAVYEILLKIEIHRAYSSSLLADHDTKLTSPDRGLCHEIVLGVLRRQLLLDRYIEVFTQDRKLDIEVRIILRMGLFQLYYLDRVPDHAIVNESVGLTQRARKSSARGLVNAVLRSATKQRPQLDFKNELEQISVETSHPKWLIEKWQKDRPADDVEKLACVNNEPPPVSFRKTIKGKDVGLPDGVVESSTVPGCFTSKSFSKELRELSDRGEIYFQDEASQMVASSIEILPGEIFLDVCASPGGKTTAVAYRSVSPSSKTGPTILAGDVSWRRVRLLNETCEKQGAGMVHIAQYDATKPLPFANEVFDHVLVDAPCTGTGTIRHNPEIRYLVRPDDFLRMQAIQRTILINASKLVRPGGSLTYSTCSLEPEENEDVCRSFLSEALDWENLVPNLPGKFLTDGGYARTFPHRDGLDGFFIATFRRR